MCEAHKIHSDQVHNPEDLDLAKLSGEMGNYFADGKDNERIYYVEI